MTFYEKVKSLCEVRGISISSLALELGFSKSTTTNWKNSENLPRAATVKKVADFFGITVGDLKTGLDETTDFDSLDTSALDQPVWQHFLELHNYNVREAYCAYASFEKSKLADAIAENSHNTINGNNNIIGNGNIVGEKPTEQEKALLRIFGGLDVVKKAQLLAYAAELEKGA